MLMYLSRFIGNFNYSALPVTANSANVHERTDHRNNMLKIAVTNLNVNITSTLQRYNQQNLSKKSVKTLTCKKLKFSSQYFLFVRIRKMKLN